LENPNSCTFEQGMPFEDFIVKEYCEYHMDKKNIEPMVKQQALSNLLENH